MSAGSHDRTGLGLEAAEVWHASTIGVLLQKCADDLAAACVLEDSSEAVIAHAFSGRRPHLLVKAVLDRSARPLHEAARKRRTCLVTSARAMQSLLLGDDPAFLLPISTAGRGDGQLWILPQEEQPSWQRMLEHAAALSRGLLGRTLEPPHWVERALTGTGPLPPAFSERSLHVVAVRRQTYSAGDVSDLLQIAARRRPSPLAHVAFLGTDEGAVALVAGSATSPVEIVTQWCQEAARIDGSQLAAAVAGPGDDPSCLPLLRSQAEQAVRAVPANAVCMAVESVRSAVVLDRLAPLLSDLPDLGRGPLKELLRHDEQRGTQLAVTLLAWLDAQADVTVAADALQVHPNTLRYRIRRAHEVLGVDIRDPEARLELHLRLRLRLRLRLADASA